MKLQAGSMRFQFLEDRHAFGERDLPRCRRVDDGRTDDADRSRHVSVCQHFARADQPIRASETVEGSPHHHAAAPAGHWQFSAGRLPEASSTPWQFGTVHSWPSSKSVLRVPDHSFQTICPNLRVLRKHLSVFENSRE